MHDPGTAGREGPPNLLANDCEAVTLLPLATLTSLSKRGSVEELSTPYISSHIQPFSHYRTTRICEDILR